MNETLDFSALIEETPAWAAACFYCHSDELGGYDEANHLDSHLPKTCPICGDTAPNRLLYEMGHTVNLGASWDHNALLCTSLSLRLNHLTYDIRNHDVPDARDATAIALGWTIAPDGAQIAPAGWPAPPTPAEVYA